MLADVNVCADGPLFNAKFTEGAKMREEMQKPK
jgi:hypothetical protein